MEIIRDEKRIERMALISKGVSFFGIFALIAGLVLALSTNAEGTGRIVDILGSTERVFQVQLAALGVGWLCSQIGMYLAHRYVRKPRPDQVLDEALGRVPRNGRLYHYVLPVSHVLLSQSGVILLNAKYQTGEISVDDDKWKQKGLGMRRFFGQEGLGNPTRETENQLKILVDFIKKNAPEVEEIPIAALIVFTHVEPKALDINAPSIPAMHYTKVKSYLRRKRRNQPISPETYSALKAAFDAKAGDLVK